MALIILDRDGVINDDSPDRILHVSQWRPIRGSLEAIALLSRSGHRVAVATNQSAIGLGLTCQRAVDAIHDELRHRSRLLGGEIAGVAVCPHAPSSSCDCRKPAPGLLRRLMGELDAVPAATWMVGDSLRDIAAGHAAGVVCALVRTGNGRRDESACRSMGVVGVFDDLGAFASWFLLNGSLPGQGHS